MVTTACALALLVPVVTTRWSADAEPTPGASSQGRLTALTGKVAGVSILEDDSVIVFVGPDQETEAGLRVGDSVHPVQLPDDAVRVLGNRYWVVLDPQTLPAATIGRTGLVNFEVMVQDPESPRFASTSASSRAVIGPDGSYTWTDPLTPTLDVSLASESALLAKARRDGVTNKLIETHVDSTVGNVAKPEAEGVLCVGQQCAPTAHAANADHVTVADAARTDQFAIPGPVVDAKAKSCHEGDGAGTVYGRTEIVPTTIGTAYPVQHDTAFMTFAMSSSSEFTASLGVGNDKVGHFQNSGTKTIERGNGFDWDPQPYARSFRVNVVYQQVSYYFDRCPPDEPYSVSWMPKQYTGGFGENRKGVERPQFTNCDSVSSQGTWWRHVTGGHDYSYGAGVKIAELIGIDLSVKRAYNQDALLGYKIHFKGDAPRMCGNDDYAASAGKAMEKTAFSPFGSGKAQRE